MNVVPLPGAGSPEYPSGSCGYATADPAGRMIRIPASAAEDHPYFRPDQFTEMRRYYHRNGYVVVRGLIPADLCRATRAHFANEVKPCHDFIYRQATANPERHVFTPDGFMLNPILNIQSLDMRRFPHFRLAGLAVMTHARVQAAVWTLIGEPGKIVQSMYFEGNPATWAHQDTYYLDAEEPGRMVGAWFAMEDIAPGAGRFYVYPESHKADMARNGGNTDIAFHHDDYKKATLDFIRQNGPECRAPALRQGDVLFWSSRTLHGSLATTQAGVSRSSVTAHYIPDSMRFLQFQSRFRKLNLERINGIRVHKPKDLNRRPQHVVFWIETAFPKAFRTAKKLAIKAHTR